MSIAEYQLCVNKASDYFCKLKFSYMHLRPVQVVDDISPEDFKRTYFNTNTPVVIKNFAKKWPAYTKWNWDYFKEIVGDKKVALYNNVKSDAYTPINKADDYKTFAEYVDMIRKGPAAWRIFFVQ